MEVVAVVAAVVVAVVFGVASADAWAVFVDIAAVVFVEVLASAGDVDVPVAFFDEDADALVCEVPPDVVKIGLGGGRFDGQGEVSAAEAGTFFTERLGHRLFSGSFQGPVCMVSGASPGVLGASWAAFGHYKGAGRWGQWREQGCAEGGVQNAKLRCRGSGGICGVGEMVAAWS